MKAEKERADAEKKRMEEQLETKRENNKILESIEEERAKYHLSFYCF